MRKPNRCPLRAFALLAMTALLWVGCSHVQFGSYETFDAWYVGREDGFHVDDIGFHALDDSIAGYIVNDVLIRTPVFLTYEATWIVLVPVALPYYGVKSMP